MQKASIGLRGLWRIPTFLGLIGLLFTWNNCTPANPNTPDGGTEPPLPRSFHKGITYQEHVRPILDRSCVACHNSKSIGPFSLSTYDEVKKVSVAVKSAVVSKRMPPWPADEKSCVEYKHSIALSPEQIKTITDWVDEGAHQGNPDKYVKPNDAGNIGLPRVDATLKMPTPYVPTKSPDDYRCFVLDWKQTEKMYVTGFQMKPGNDKIVHHVIAYVGTAKDKAYYKKKDADEPGPGYTCYGGPGGGDAQWVAAWAPGKPGGLYPKGTGIKIEPGSVIIVQLHYNTLKDKPAPDQTSVELMLEKTVEKEGFILPISASDFKIPKNMKEYVYEKILPETDPKTGKEKGRVNIPLMIHAVSLHMHLLGSSSKFWVQRADGTKECLLNIPRWDFNWQYFYDLKTPVAVSTKDFVGVRCVWNNSASNQPLVDGKRLSSREVTWGDGSTDEMCLAIAYVTANL